MNCPICAEELVCAPINPGDIAVCPECGEILAIASLMPVVFRVANEHDRAELYACDNGHKILMYSDLLKAQRKGISAPIGNA